MSHNYGGKLFFYQPDKPLFQSQIYIKNNFNDICLLNNKNIIFIYDKSINIINKNTYKITTYNEKEIQITDKFKYILKLNFYEKNIYFIIIYNLNEIFLYSISKKNVINFIDKANIEKEEQIKKVNNYKTNILILFNNKISIYNLNNKKFEFIKNISFKDEINDIIQINNNKILIYLKKEKKLVLYDIVEEKDENNLIVMHNGKFYNLFGLMKLINDNILIIIISNALFVIDINLMKIIKSLYYYELPKNLREKSCSFNRFYNMVKQKQNNCTIKSIIYLKDNIHLAMSAMGNFFILLNLTEKDLYLSSYYYKKNDFNYIQKINSKSFLCFKQPNIISIFNINN